MATVARDEAGGEGAARFRRRRHGAGRLGPQGNRHCRARDAGPDGHSPQVRRRAAAQGRAHRRQPAHDHPDGRAHRDAAGPRRRDSLGQLQHLLDAGPRRRRHRRQGHAGLRQEGRNARRILGLHPPHPSLARRRHAQPHPRRRRRRHPARPPRLRGGEGPQRPRPHRRNPRKRPSCYASIKTHAAGPPQLLQQDRQEHHRRLRGNDHRRQSALRKWSRRARCSSRPSTSTTA